RYRDAERWMLDLVADAPNARIGAEAMLVAGRAQYRQGRADAGRATLLRTAERYPGQRAAARAVYLVADLTHDDNDVARASTLYRRVVDIDANAREAGLALMRLAGIRYVEGDRAGALRVWEEYRQRHPDGRNYQQATFWAARAYRELGQDSLARARLHEVRRVDPISFYSARAAEAGRGRSRGRARARAARPVARAGPRVRRELRGRTAQAPLRPARRRALRARRGVQRARVHPDGHPHRLGHLSPRGCVEPP